MTVVGAEKMAVFDDMELDRKVTVYDKAAEQATGTYGEWRTRTGDIWIPKIPNDEPLRLECEHFLGLVRGEGDRFEAARDGVAVVRALAELQRSLERERHMTVARLRLAPVEETMFPPRAAFLQSRCGGTSRFPHTPSTRS